MAAVVICFSCKKNRRVPLACAMCGSTGPVHTKPYDVTKSACIGYMPLEALNVLYKSWRRSIDHCVCLEPKTTALPPHPGIRTNA